MKQSPLERMLVGFELEGTIAPPDGSPSIGRRQASWLGHQCSLLLGERESDRDGMGHSCGSEAGTRITLRSDAVDYSAHVVEEVFYDPTGHRLKM